jgi:hypothetical protein
MASRTAGVWLEGLVEAGLAPGDSQEDALRKAILILSTITILVFATASVVMYAALGLYLAAVIPLGYQVLSLAGLLVFVRTKNFRVFRFAEIALMLLLPFALQWTLGGFLKSGGRDGLGVHLSCRRAAVPRAA